MRKKFVELAVWCSLFVSLILLAVGRAVAGIPSFSPTVSALEITSNIWPQVVAQGNIGECACGPCAVFNAFRFGDPALARLASALPGATGVDKVRDLIARYGGRASVVTPDEPRYLANGGMWDEDIVPFINDCLAGDGVPPVTGERLSLEGGESGVTQMRRVYGELRHSLDAGFPPVVNLQSYSMHRSFFHHEWKWMDGHFVTVVGVQNSFPADADGFSMWVADSESGRVLRVFVYADQSAASVETASGRAKRSGSAVDHSVPPYLMIQSPRLQTILAGAASDSKGIICVLQFIAHR